MFARAHRHLICCERGMGRMAGGMAPRYHPSSVMSNARLRTCLRSGVCRSYVRPRICIPTRLAVMVGVWLSVWRSHGIPVWRICDCISIASEFLLWSLHVLQTLPEVVPLAGRFRCHGDRARILSYFHRRHMTPRMKVCFPRFCKNSPKCRELFNFGWWYVVINPRCAWAANPIRNPAF